MIVTGAAGGIGSATAAAFAKAGASVLCVDRSDAVIAVAAAARASGGIAVAAVRDVEEAEAIGAEAIATFGGADVLYSNAAVQVMGDLITTTPLDWDRMYAVNLRAIAPSRR